MRVLLLAPLALVCAPCASAQADWSLVRMAGSKLTDLAHDARRGVSVLFEQGETWELDDAWLRREPAVRPSPRHGHALAFDHGRGVVTLFGGTNGLAVWYQDTWDWDGSTWHLRATSGPTPRSNAAMAWDPIAVRLLLFGGASATGASGARSDTWHFDGSTWTLLPVATIPPARILHTLTTDLGRRCIVMYGGHAAVTLGDTWEWNGANWLPTAPLSSPGTRIGHRACFDETRQRVRLFGGGLVVGSVTTPRDDTWEWDGSLWTQVPATGPVARARASVCWDRRRAAMVVAGGGNGTRTYRDTWTLRDTAWTRDFASGPGSPSMHAACFDSHRRRIVVWSSAFGIDGSRLFEWDDHAWHEFGPANQPSSRAFPSMVYDSARQRTVLFGGQDLSTIYNETWLWNGQSWTRHNPITSPSPRWAHGMAWDDARQRVVLFGGYTSSSGAMSGETWEFDGSQWQQRLPVNLPMPRVGPGMAYDPRRQRTVLFGGLAVGPNVMDDTWNWDGTSWTQSPATGPLARYHPGMGFDAGSNRVLLHGGRTLRGALNDLWEFDGLTWQIRATATLTPELSQHSLLPDGNGALLALFGERRDGATPSASDQVWRLGTTVPARATPTGSGCVGGSQPHLRATEPALVTRLLRFEIDGITAGAAALLVIGDGFGATPLGSGCTFYVQGNLAVLLDSANTSGIATLRLVMSGSPALRGLGFTAQAAALDPVAPLGFALTGAVRLVLGD